MRARPRLEAACKAASLVLLPAAHCPLDPSVQPCAPHSFSRSSLTTCYLPGTGTTHRPQMLVITTLLRGLCPQSRRETPRGAGGACAEGGRQVPCLLHGCDPNFLGCRAICGPSWHHRWVGRARLQSRLRKAPETVSFQKFLSKRMELSSTPRRHETLAPSALPWALFPHPAQSGHSESGH